MPARLHHMAFRCRDSEETRAFYEDVIGLPLTAAMPIEETKTGRRTRVLHTFFQLKDGSFIAFFEAPDQPFEFKPQHDFDLHLALESDAEEVARVTAAARRAGVEIRGPSDHGFVTSHYFRDPNGYVVELAVKSPAHAGFEADAPEQAHAILRAWSEAKAPAQA
jgi:catechol 2,3-dioxygenase-like lactoylglutathione lyase family enzyme